MVKYLVAVLLILLVILHQDYWQWDDATLVYGFVPWTLVYHVGLSLGAAAVWWLTVRFCWPENPSE